MQNIGNILRALKKLYFIGLLISCIHTTPNRKSSISPTYKRVPGASWQKYTNLSEAGFEADKIRNLMAQWKADNPSIALMIVSDGAIVDSYGDLRRRFRCFSTRKSFLSALFGVEWDKKRIDLDRTIKDMGLDDHPNPLLPIEKEARIFDLLTSRSGIFHDSAYGSGNLPKIRKLERGTKKPGEFFIYNNWDFNSLASILISETGTDITQEFNTIFAEPLQFQDWRQFDVSWKYERQLSRFPAYLFKMSARDAARFGLLYANLGKWGKTKVLSKAWIEKSTKTYSGEAQKNQGYAFMWWTVTDPRLAKDGFFMALGSKGQMIAVSPKQNLVVVSWPNTYLPRKKLTKIKDTELHNLLFQIISAKVKPSIDSPDLVSVNLPQNPNNGKNILFKDEILGDWNFKMRDGKPDRVSISKDAESFKIFLPSLGTFRIFLVAEDLFQAEDSNFQYQVVRDSDGKIILIQEL